jgi:hypothetical protein
MTLVREMSTPRATTLAINRTAWTYLMNDGWWQHGVRGQRAQMIKRVQDEIGRRYDAQLTVHVEVKL